MLSIMIRKLIIY